MLRTERFNDILAKAGLSVIKLHAIWVKASKGNVHSCIQLEQIMFDHPGVRQILRTFEQGGVLSSGKKTAVRNYLGEQKKAATSWERGRVAGTTSSGVVSGGLPSLGKRR